MQAHDPDAAAYLLAHLDVPSDEGLPSPSQHEPYNPIRLYAIMAKACHWTFETCDAMDYQSFFAMVREIALLNEAENRQQNAPPASYESPEYHHHRFR